MVATPAAVEWLLAADEPAVRYRARTWLVGQAETDADASADRDAIPDGPIVSTLLDFPAMLNPPVPSPRDTR